MDETSTFETVAPELIRRGYLPVPVHWAKKNPIPEAWQNLRIEPQDCGQYAGAGTGVLCGQGTYPILGVDIDVLSSPKMVQRFSDWMQEQYGPTVVRIGKAPKALLFYRLDKAGVPKRVSMWFKVKQRLELMGNGEQVVAYNEHMDTHMPYRYEGLVGAIADVDARDLPVIPHADLDRIVDTFEQMALEEGLVPASETPQLTPEQQEGSSWHPAVAGYTLEKAKRDLDSLPPEACEDYDIWIRVGLALHHQFEGSMEACALWDEWSSKSSKYKGTKETQYKWKGFVLRAGVRPITARYLIRKGREARGETANYLRTESGNCQRVADLYAGSLMNWRQTGRWYAYEDGIWQQRSNGFVQGVIRQVVLAMFDEVIKEWRDNEELIQTDKKYRNEMQEKLAFALNCQKASHFKAVATIAATDDALSAEDPGFDNDTDLIGFRDVDYRISTDTVQPHSPDSRLTLQMPVAFNRQAQCPLFRKVVLDAFCGDSGMAAYFQRVMGYALMGNPKEQCFFVLHGGGSNGKSTIMSVVQKAMGPYALSAQAETFVTRGAAANAGGAREDVVRLRGSRLVLAMESDESSVLKEATVKAMTGGDVITARAPYATSSIQFRSTFVIFLSTNHEPIIRGADFGIWRRIKLIPFLRNFKKEGVADPDLPQKLDGELEGIAAWLIEGLQEYRRIGLSEPQKVVAASEEYRGSMDLLGQFIAEECEEGKEFSVKVSDLFAAWRSYAERTGEGRFIGDVRNFGRKMKEKQFCSSTVKNSRCYFGLRLRDEAA